MNACGVLKRNSGGYGNQYRFFFRSVDSADADNEAAEATGDDETSKVSRAGFYSTDAAALSRNASAARAAI